MSAAETVLAEFDHMNSSVAIASKLNTALLALHRERLARLGSEGSGLYSHYETVIGRGALVGAKEANIAEVVLRSLPRFRQYHVLRAGLGELALLLAALELPVAAFEPNNRRREAIADGITCLSDRSLLALSDIETRADLLAGRDNNNTLAIATELILALSDDGERSLLDRIASYDAVLIAPAQFLRRRKSADDKEAAIEQLRERGFSVVWNIADLDLAYCAKPIQSVTTMTSGPNGHTIALNDDAASGDLPLLIFDRLSVRWNEITLKQPLQRPTTENWTLRSFPLPGSVTAQDLSRVQINPAGLTFPEFGSYRVVGPFGAIKILLIDPLASDDDRIIAISRFVAKAAYHSGADAHLVREGASTSPRYLDAVLRKLFFSDQPLALWCGDIADVLAFLLHNAGFRCRLVHTANHMMVEVFFPDMKKWAIVDPDLGALLRHEGQMISAADVVRLRDAGSTDEIEMEWLSQARFAQSPLNFPVSFTGQFTWEPEHLYDQSKDYTSYYRNVVISQGFSKVAYCEFCFENRAVTKIRPTVRYSKPLSLQDIEASAA